LSERSDRGFLTKGNLDGRGSAVGQAETGTGVLLREGAR
jgi:hypothetical protein